MGVSGNHLILDPKAKPQRRPRAERGGMLGKEECEKENYFLLCDLELSGRLYFSVGCRRKKTIAEEGLCRVDQGNSSKVHDRIEEVYIPYQRYES